MVKVFDISQSNLFPIGIPYDCEARAAILAPNGTNNVQGSMLCPQNGSAAIMEDLIC